VLLDLVGNGWGDFLAEDISSTDVAALRRHERTGRPLGDPEFVDGIENQLGRSLRRNKPGPKAALGA
jgi:putative transposase